MLNTINVPTLGSVSRDDVDSRLSSSVTSLTLSSCKWIISFCSLLRKSMPFCESTHVMAVVHTHYIKLNSNRNISCSINTDNSCFVQTYCIITHKITNTKKSPNQRTLLLHNIVADGRTMCRVPIMSQTNPVHTSTWFNGKYKIVVMIAHPTDGRKDINSCGE